MSFLDAIAPQPATPPSPAAPSFNQTMIAPNGQSGEVPPDRVDEALKAGFSHGTILVSPEGKEGTVPTERAPEALKAGFRQKDAWAPMKPDERATMVVDGMPVNMNVPAGYGTEVQKSINAAPQHGLEIGSMVLPGAEAAVNPEMALKIGRSVVGGLVGSGAGGYLGREVGSLVGAPGIGEKIGGLAGGLYGGYKGSIGERPQIPSLRHGLMDLFQSGEESSALPEKLPTIKPSTPEIKPGEAYNVVPPKGKRIPTIQDLGKLIEQEGAGVKPLQRNVPIGQQVPAKLPEVGQVPLGNRVALDVRDLGEQRINAPEKMPTIPQEEVGREMGAPPLQPNRPLREQFKPDAEAMAHQSEQSRLEQKYPDKAMRQMVHANGEAMVDAIGDDPETLRAIHDLRNPDIRQAVINSGEDMGQKNIGNRKAMGEGQMTRQDALGLLLKKGYTPQQIIEMAQPPEEVGAAKPGPQRMTGFKKEERQAGD